jgi:hypothetical protein
MLTSPAESEAMWIDFKNRDVITYQIKIYVGGVNAISGEPFDENAATRRRREEKMAAVRNEKVGNGADGGANTNNKDADKKKGPASSLQDYFVVPGQYWLDGIANGDGTVRQFIAMPFGSRHTVESQITGQDTTGGIQFEIKPDNTPLRGPPVTLTGKPYQIYVRTLSGTTITLLICATTTVDELNDIIAYQLISGTFRNFYLSFAGYHLLEGRTLENYGVGKVITTDCRYKQSLTACDIAEYYSHEQAFSWWCSSEASSRDERSSRRQDQASYTPRHTRLRLAA